MVQISAPDAQAATENSQESNSTGNGQESSSSSNTGSGQESSSSNTGSGQQLSSSSGTGNREQGNNTGNASADLVNTVLEIHNKERAAVGSPALVWSNKLAADAKTWADHMSATGSYGHDIEHLPTLGEGQNWLQWVR